MSIATFRVKQPRPTHLSDPGNDFPDSWLEMLLATPDDKMEWSEYQNLLQPYLPAGNYEESVYFLPNAFRYLISHEDTEFVAYTIIGFVSKNRDKLAEDGILEEARACIHETLDFWTHRFGFIPREPHHGDHYFVQYAEDIAKAIDDLNEFMTDADIALTFVQSLADHGSDVIKAAWYLEYAYQVAIFYGPVDNPAIMSLVSNHDRLQRAAYIAKPLLKATPLYWKEIAERLNLI